MLSLNGFAISNYPWRIIIDLVSTKYLVEATTFARQTLRPVKEVNKPRSSSNVQNISLLKAEKWVPYSYQG